MAGKSLNELALKDEVLPELDYASMPEFGSWAPPPQPGTYRFALPKDMTNIWDVYEKDGKQFIRAVFDKDAPLLIVQAKDEKYVGEPFQTRISNQPRPRGKDKIEISDMDLLLRALGLTQRPKGNKATIEAMKAQISKEFKADISYSWICGEDRDIRVADASGNHVVVEGEKGCGRKFYQDDQTQRAEQKIARLPNGEYPYEITCPCKNNVIRAFANLNNIRA